MGHDGGGTARTTVDRLVLGVLRQTVSSLVSQRELDEKGSSIYADMITPAPSPSPTPSPACHIVVSDGEFDVVGYCVHSPNYPSDSGSIQVCDIRF